MKVFKSSAKATKFLKKGSAITLGNFDGVHLGHRALIGRIVLEAKKRGIAAVVYTFQPHPVRLLSPHNAPPLINTIEQKIELIASLDVDALVLEPFTPDFSHTTPHDFFEHILIDRLHAQFLISGYDFTFGARRSGDRETLKNLGGQHGIDVAILKPQFSGETLVSSSLIRKYVQEGQVKVAGKYLCRPFFLDGTIVKGQGRGRTIGIPTANLKTKQELIPAYGVYATHLIVSKKTYPSVTNIGIRPTFGGDVPTIETHLLGFKGNLYKKKVRLEFVDFIREERHFDSVKTLATQINKDINKVKQILKKNEKK